MPKETCKTILKIMTGKEFVHFTPRCNRSIEIAMQVLKRLSRTTVLFQEEGGWLTYEKYIQQAGLEPIKMITDDGLVYEKEVSRYDMDAALIINSLAGYVALQDMDSLSGVCATHDVFLINDVSGSIGLPQGKVGDIVVGSFGKAKPVNLGSGGFIATNDKEIFDLIKELDPEEEDLPFTLLEKKLRTLEERRTFLQQEAQKIKDDLKDLNIVHPEHKGINVIIRYEDDVQKQKILSYCKEHDLEFTECPRMIRILDNAISIEVKRLV
ncbi:MAG: DegT/DnrJ/EryC1/StrS family aminotransferase [Nanoarchaeota archaeon]|nr:DegT/DnrJ/EryC1/StrS family aminotransferase [Nanoarchaeota archaeon]